MNTRKKITNPKIAVIPGDGIGKEVMPEGVRALEAAAKKFGIQFQFDHFDFASCDYYQQHGKMMPDNWFDTLMKYDAIFFGAVGMPNILPDHLSLWGSLIQFRRGFDQYVNLRPVRLLPGVPCPLANRKPGDIDFFVVRENTEGEYSAVGGKMFADTDREIVVQESVFSRHGVDRILKFAYELAQSRPKKHLTSATKSNGIAITMPRAVAFCVTTFGARTQKTLPVVTLRSMQCITILAPKRYSIITVVWATSALKRFV